MKVDYDEKADILYIRIDQKSKIVDTDTLDDDVLVDFDKNGKIVAIEVWGASKNITEPIAKVLAKKLKSTMMAKA
jgi:uncharacterized protein YuzE